MFAEVVEAPKHHVGRHDMGTGHDMHRVWAGTTMCGAGAHRREGRQNAMTLRHRSRAKADQTMTCRREGVGCG